MHQPQDDNTNQERDKCTTDKARVEKSSPGRPNTFGGLKRGFILFGAPKLQTGQDHMTTKVFATTGNTTTKVSPESKADDDIVIRKLLKNFTSYHPICGDIEFQVFSGRDIDKEGGQEWAECTKYPGHEGFIPLPEFCLEKHLPERFQDEDFLHLIKSFADLTVRLRVKVRGRSPDDPFSTASSFTGTAFIGSAESHVDDCFCKKCTAKGPKNQMWWCFNLTSATHCIDNENEADDVKVDFFYDHENSQRNREMKTIHGVRVLTASHADDLCTFQCATHDEGLGRRIQLGTQKERQLIYKLHLKQASRPVVTGNKLMLCISHPHGKPKQVTVGELSREYDVTYEDPEQAQAVVEHTAETGIEVKWFDYSTKTCPGSSGAQVFCIDDLTSGEWRGSFSTDCTHSSRIRETGLNKGFARKWGSLEKCRAWLARKGVISSEKLKTWTQENWTGPGNAPWVDKKQNVGNDDKKEG